MGIRNSMEEDIVVSGERNTWLKKCENSLNNQGFTKVNVNNSNFIKDDTKSYIDSFLPSTKFQEFYKKNNKPIYSMKLLKK